MEECSGCKRGRTWEEDMYWKHFNSMHFFLFLPSDFHHHLVLPDKFAENMKAKLPTKVSLIGPSSAVWDVELKKTNDIEFAGDGWKEFVKAYDLEEGDLLMFKYKQFSSFKVLILDPDSFCAKEASYFVKPCSHPKAALENEKKRTITEAFSIEVIEEDEENCDDHDDPEFVASKKPKNDVTREWGRRKSSETPREDTLAEAPQSEGRPERMPVPEKEPEGNEAVHDMGENGAAKHQSHVLEDDRNTTENGGSLLEKTLSPGSVEQKGSTRKHVANRSSRKLVFQNDSAGKFFKEYKSNRRPVTETEIDNALERARQVIPERRRSFVAVMKPSAVYKRFYLNIPAAWIKQCLGCRNCQAVLRIGEKTWAALFYYCNRGGWGAFSSGWKKFALDNNLEESDFCLFKLATEKNDPVIVMDVEIFRVVPEIVPPTPLTRSK